MPEIVPFGTGASPAQMSDALAYFKAYMSDDEVGMEILHGQAGPILPKILSFLLAASIMYGENDPKTWIEKTQREYLQEYGHHLAE